MKEININYKPYGAIYVIEYHMDGNLINERKISELLQMPAELFRKYILSQHGGASLRKSGNDFQLYFTNVKDCESAMLWIKNNISNIRNINGFYITTEEITYYEGSSYFKEKYKQEKLFCISILSNNDYKYTDYSISKFLGITINEFHELITDNYKYGNIISENCIFTNLLDCKKSIDILADNFESLLIVKTLLNK